MSSIRIANPMKMSRDEKLKANKWASVITLVLLVIAIIICAVGMYAQKKHNETVAADGTSAWSSYLSFKDTFILITLIIAAAAAAWSWFSSVKLFDVQ